MHDELAIRQCCYTRGSRLASLRQATGIPGRNYNGRGRGLVAADMQQSLAVYTCMHNLPLNHLDLLRRRSRHKVHGRLFIHLHLPLAILSRLVLQPRHGLSFLLARSISLLDGQRCSRGYRLRLGFRCLKDGFGFRSDVNVDLYTRLSSAESLA